MPSPGNYSTPYVDPIITPLSGCRCNGGGGEEFVGYIEYTMDLTYTTGKTGLDFLHLPEGHFYPIGYGLIDALYSNGVLTRKGIDWEEAPWPIPGSGPWANVSSQFNFVNSRARIAWGIRLLRGWMTNEDDEYRLVWRERVVPYAPNVRPIFVTPQNNEAWDGTKYHDSHNPPPPIGDRMKVNAIAIDGRSDYSVLIWRKPRTETPFGYYAKPSNQSKHHQGRGFRPYLLIGSGQYFMPETHPLSHFDNERSRKGYKVSYFDTVHGAIGIHSAETIWRVGRSQVDNSRYTYLIV